VPLVDYSFDMLAIEKLAAICFQATIALIVKAITDMETNSAVKHKPTIVYFYLEAASQDSAAI